jgi:hypothetical protein
MANPAGNYCSGCDYWDKTAPDSGRCRARPPIVLTHAGHAAWPTTGSDDWCGLFESTPPVARRT